MTNKAIPRGLKYSPQTGMLYTPNGPVLQTDRHGYRRVTFKKIQYHTHKIAWISENGEVPEGMHIDHINRDRTDNRVINLRLASRQQNGANRGPTAHNKSGWKGVHWCKHWKKWVAAIVYGGKKRYIGSSHSLYEAVLTYNIYALSLHDPYVYINPLPRYGTTEWSQLFNLEIQE